MKIRTNLIILIVLILLGIIFIKPYKLTQSTDCYPYPEFLIKNNICIGKLTQFNETLSKNINNKDCNLHITGSKCLGINIPLSTTQNG